MLKLTFWAFQNSMTLDDRIRCSKVTAFKNILCQIPFKKINKGCKQLLEKLQKLPNYKIFLVNLPFHYFSHISPFWSKKGQITFFIWIYYWNQIHRTFPHDFIFGNKKLQFNWVFLIKAKNSNLKKRRENYYVENVL